jgi:superkiller protein 3
MICQDKLLDYARKFLYAALLLAPLYTPGATAQNPPSDPATIYAQGEALLREHQWDQCLSTLEPLLKVSPANPKLLNLIGLAYTGKGDPQRGDEFFKQAIKLSPGFVPALKNLGINEFGLGQYKAADESLRSALRASPDDPVIHLYLGESAYQQQDFGQAAEHLHRAGAMAQSDAQVRSSLAVSDLKTANKDAALALLADLPPDSLSARAQFVLGAALAESELSAQAIPYLEAVRRAYPGVPDIAYDLALCQIGDHRYAEAVATLRALIDSGHETAELNNLLAEAYQGEKQTQPAVDALRRAIALDPQDDNNYLDFATLCIDHQAFADAAKVLEAGLSVHPKSARLIFERGILNAMQDHFDQAEKDFAASAALAPQDNSGYIGLGVTYIETGNTADAIKLLRKRLAAEPNNANIAYLLGEALIKSGAQQGDPAFAEAQTDFEQSVRLDPSLSAPHASLGSMYLQQGKLQEAVDQLEQARRIDPKDKAAYSHLAVAYRRLGQQDKAREVLTRLQAINAAERDAPGPRVREGAAGSSTAAGGPNR